MTNAFTTPTNQTKASPIIVQISLHHRYGGKAKLFWVFLTNGSKQYKIYIQD